MIALFSLLIIIFISIIVVRIGAIALELTGLSSEVASFQAQSAFSGVGFTTEESESIVTHPVRRKIIRILILLGSVGLSSSIATLILTFVGSGAASSAYKGSILLCGLLLIYLFARSKFIYKIMKKIIIKALKKWTSIQVIDYEQILGMSKGFSICKIKVKPNNWMSGKLLKDLKLNMEGVLVLSIYRRVGKEERLIGAPRGDNKILAGDTLICYGRDDTLRELSMRVKGAKGDMAHKIEVEKEQNLEKARELSGGYD